MRVKRLNGYWVIYSGEQPVLSCASLSEALAQMIACSRALRYSAASDNKQENHDVLSTSQPTRAPDAGDD